MQIWLIAKQWGDFFVKMQINVQFPTNSAV